MKTDDIFKEIFDDSQLVLIKRSIVKTVEINPMLKVSVLKIGRETNILMYGSDLNGNVHYTMLSEESFGKLKKLKLKGA